MAWTAPMTAVANNVWTAAQFNTHVRDNLNATEAAVTTAALQYMVATGANVLAARTAGSNTVATLETTTSTTYVNLTTSGPAVTVTTGTTALIMFTTQMSNSSANVQCYTSYGVTGATTSAETDTRATLMSGVILNNTNRFGMAHMHTGLTAGSNTFTLKYRVSAGTGSFQRREIIVVPM